MNLIYLKGYIKNIRYSHTINGVDFNKADLIVKRPDGSEDILIVKGKQFNLTYKEDTEIELIGNIRSYSQRLNGKNRVEIYVFSYFDRVTIDMPENVYNDALLTGRICKKEPLMTTNKGKHFIHFIVANNLREGNNKLNSYIPCVAWGQVAKDVENNYNINDVIKINGQLHSREYKKILDDNNIELRVAHEFAVVSIDKNTVGEAYDI